MDPLQLDIIFRLIISAVLGAILGFEREYVGKSAGLRTYMLVSLGSALFTILSEDGLRSYIGISSFDPSRIISQIVVGVGFIGAGLIIFQPGENKIRGLTTAAGLWTVAAIGVSVGLKYYLVSIFTTFFILIVLSGSRYFNLETRIHRLSDRRNKNVDSNSQ
ncbi:MAG: MgtC family magnesium (Mg2+) transporter [Parcubacteria group bacterium GW2011_GWD2_38_12]|uniref:MgtC/SapB/SrpB/YhiD N-terminal domain-containing protein n=1 Tax=Candidatus Azambacteria bacterium RIFCSPLOWO2_01_FULL_37_9 TaxID=1797297 RepID=A0A1F5C6I0_9BACT|nr:MAG: MgtC family magnesium (Mg2+) transporter [Parcubacteria group bacterium GW2011_GWC2_36_17]KKQ43803.1 MAG: MgtC family magnesium (Mg2+) transporter [Parcubacteria group bacterium GW2011_GWE2_37_8]KKQ51453.1 MAG: MgtC family magnesium (Mg2+) transporter [Parcubacteria group bacterium GW2011_GWD2_38_12]KKQ58722.1 MAG: MgtC family magnesium (Mg2+) transporter [Parcubacteria group bacterium GW2011_GWC1_38_17]KKQ59315.1 MAG: MgtC family magnesium (Mg2+) transporter [Parcubacteria group bacter